MGHAGTSAGGSWGRHRLLSGDQQVHSSRGGPWGGVLELDSVHTRRVRCDLCARGLQRLVGELGQGHVRINLNPGRCPSSAECTD